jgi:hypothetical protein
MLKNRLARLNLRKNLKYYLAGLLIVACAVTAVLVFTLGGGRNGSCQRDIRRIQ